MLPLLLRRKLLSPIDETVKSCDYCIVRVLGRAQSFRALMQEGTSRSISHNFVAGYSTLLPLLRVMISITMVRFGALRMPLVSLNNLDESENVNLDRVQYRFTLNHFPKLEIVTFKFPTKSLK
jgi:hypothetical protein